MSTFYSEQNGIVSLIPFGDVPQGACFYYKGHLLKKVNVTYKNEYGTTSEDYNATDGNVFRDINNDEMVEFSHRYIIDKYIEENEVFYWSY